LPRMGRRYKSYQAETGVTYQYCFETRRSVLRPEGQGRGSDFIFIVTADQRPPFVLRVFVAERALGEWREKHGRELTPNEQYAAAKMRLYRAFDDLENVGGEWLLLLVDEVNVEDLLAPLELA
jgi:hypothetical protein